MLRNFYKFGCGLVSSFLGGFLFFIIGSGLAAVFPDVNFGGDMAGVLWGIIIGMPLGSVAGFLIVDKTFYRLKSNNFLGMVIGFIAGFLFGGIGGIFLLDSFGEKLIVLIPLLIVLFSIIGYQIGLKRVSQSDLEPCI
jgi:hypothetical protein